VEKDESMSSFFKNKVIYIFSPQPWNYLQISKHHYARALAAHNRVYFIAPPVSSKSFSFSLDKKDEGLYLLNYTLAAPVFLRFKLPALYKLLLRTYLSRLLRIKLPAADVAFDFGCYQEFNSLDFTDAKNKIYFPVDDSDYFVPLTRGADLVLTVSKSIQAKFPEGKCHFINHGLSEAFSRVTLLDLANNKGWKPGPRISVGYAGNLFIRYIDRVTIEILIETYPFVDFHFFGLCSPSKLDDQEVSWYEYLNKKSHVFLHGVLTTEALAEKYRDIDVFLLCYKPVEGFNRADNSHKIIEYLSSGKVIISSYISLYSGTDLFFMMPDFSNDSFRSTFDSTINNLNDFNTIEFMNYRRLFSLGHTYDKNIELISSLIGGMDKE